MHIREQIQRIAGTFGIDLVQKLTCTVNSVNVNNRSCLVTPQNSSIGQLSAFLMAETDDGILILPSENSTVKVLYSRLNAATVIQYSAIDSILLIPGGSTLQIDSSGIYLDGKDYGGLVKLIDPSNNSAGVLARLNKIETDINTLKSLIQILATTPGVVTTTPGDPDAFYTLFASTMSDYYANMLVSTKRADLENTLVQHGDGS